MAILVTALGACVGSFLNVVIYRLPRGLSVGNPKRSFCPRCDGTIAGYDNIPLMSYLFLRGRCRRCRSPISLQYPLVEFTTALLFLCTYDAFIAQGLRRGVGSWPQDGAIVVAHWILWAGLLATAVMDVEAYHLDVRVTWFASGAGIVCHTLWTPTSSDAWPRPGPALAAGSIAAALALGITWLYTVARERTRRCSEPSETDTPGPPAEPSPQDEPAGAPRAIISVTVPVLSLLLLAGYIAWMGFSSPPAPGVSSHSGPLRALAVVLVLMAMTVAACGRPRPADEEIYEAIRAESPSARRTALRELLWLAPALGIGFAVACASPHLLTDAPGDGALDWSPVGQWRPVLGVATGLSGFVIAGGIGWAVRILFTGVLGREAFGVGDIHMMAAAGAVAGWRVVLLGFFISAPLALLGVLFFLLFRRSSRAIQYGPWLGLGFFLTALFQDRMIDALQLRWLLG